MPFLEDRLPIGVRIGMQSQEMFSVDVSVDSANNRYTKLISPVPQYAFSFDYIKKNTDLAASVVSLYRRVYGSYAAFRVYAHDDHTTAQDGVSEPTALDCTLKQISATVYQLQKEYGLGQAALPTIGRPKRLLHKPHANTAKIAVAGVVVTTGFTVDYTTGMVTFSVAPAGAVTGGCRFDIPCAFVDSFDVTALEKDWREISGIALIEVLNP